ncbi:MAG TPA: FAD-dependent oxidoreductase [Sandaracinaceae bacterium LLY-WYZ-13_1]|nr:FAD-dependent oxidoreductase [Sandaracinaceae bacterium LLY-WYZ-13_1]
MDLCDRLPAHLQERVRPLGETPRPPRFVLYWMRTALRAHENPALDVALHLARALGVPAFVYRALSERYPYASDRHHTFVLEGQRDVGHQLAARSIGTAFHLERPGHRGPHLVALAREAGLVVTEDLPVPPLARWTAALAERAKVPVLRVDTACVAPMRLTAKAPGRAFAFRRATADAWETRLAAPWPEADDPAEAFVPELPFEPVDLDEASVPDLVAACAIDHAVGPVPHTPGGTEAGYRRWDAFVARGGLEAYAKARNDPARDGTSRMSAYLHFGMVSPRRLARDARARGAEKLLDELLTWRELAHTFCLHTTDPERLDALPAWARQTLDAHRDDPREPRSWERLSRGQTGEPLWDVAQRSLLVHGELHNDLRMTWAKAIPYWTESPERALDVLIDLNHRYALDGRDPASYGGLLWCLGLFDRPYAESPVLGRVRTRSLRRAAERTDLGRLTARVSRPARDEPPTVAVIGAGVAGLTCARTLADHGWSVTVFEKARGPGGRMATRRTDGDGARFDHGAQYFTARDPRFARWVHAWAHEGLVAPWPARFATVEGGEARPESPEAIRWIGARKMSAVCGHLASSVSVVTGARVAPPRRASPGWTLRTEDGRPLGRFDVVVSTAPAPQSAALWSEAPELADRIAAAEMAPCWAVMLELEAAPAVGWDAAKIRGGPLAWVARNGSKGARGREETWVLHAAPDWSTEHLERAPEEVLAPLVAAFRELTGAGEPRRAVAHRWRHAKTIAPVGEPCLFDPALGAGACGDWLLGAKVEAAFLSGCAMAGRLLGAEHAPAPAQPSLL